VTLVGVRILDCDGGGSLSRAIKGIDWVAAHAERPAVANMSLKFKPPSEAMDAAVRAAVDEGVVVAVSAGNDNGTSMSAPHVAGVAGLYLGAHPRASAPEVARALKSGSTKDVLYEVEPGSPNRLVYSRLS